MRAIVRAALLLVINFFVSISWAQTCDKTLEATTPSSDFTDNKDGTVTHAITGLMWKKCSEGQVSSKRKCVGKATSHTYKDALAQEEHVNNQAFAGYQNWRLPSLEELASIVERACDKPAINSNIFPNITKNKYWSSSPSAYYDDYAWSMYFVSGNGYSSNKDALHNVRLVRDK